MNANRIFAIGAAFGAAGVALGAFGAHGLEETLAANGERAEKAWETASHYHLVGAFAILATGLLAHRLRCRGPAIAAIFFSLGILLFSGSLYAWSVSQMRPLVFFTPVGGVMLICGFVTLALSSWAECGDAEKCDSPKDIGNR